MRIYQPFVNEKNIVLNERNQHHVINVMRCRENDVCYVFDGNGREVKARISKVTKKEVIVDILEEIENNNESPLKIHLFQALCKGDKMDVIIQKSVELGVTDITPLITERCDVKLSSDRLEKKVEHWRNIIIHATEQSGRAVLAKLNEPLSLREAIQQQAQHLRLLFTPQSEKKLSDVGAGLVPAQSKFAIFIGPEGGFSESEVAYAIDHGVDALMLGKRILRTETAPIAIIAALQTLWGDFKS